MFRHLTLAAVSIAVMSMSPVPVITGTAFAQACPNTVGSVPCRHPGTSTYECSSQLGHLRRVYEEELEEIEDPNLVSIVPVCINESYGLMRSDGNAGALREVIANNDAMTTALFRQNFGPEDVVGVRMVGDETVILYAHPFDHM